jgi:hypothetical protein
MKVIFRTHCCCWTRFCLVQQFRANRPKYFLFRPYNINSYFNQIGMTVLCKCRFHHYVLLKIVSIKPTLNATNIVFISFSFGNKMMKTT